MLTTIRAAIAAALLPGFYALGRVRLEPPAGVVLAGSAAPELFAMVRELAGAVGTRTPDEIRLGGEADAAVTEQARRLGLRAGRRYLYLGVPLLQALTVSQLRAVVAHELAHYAHRYARLGALTCRGQRAVVRTLARVGPRSLVGFVLRGYARLFFGVSMAVSRRMELAADQAAVRVAGRSAAAAVLHELPATGAAWHFYLSTYVYCGLDTGSAPTGVFAGFGELLRARGGDLAEVRAAAAQLTGSQQQASRWDPHAPLDARVALIEREPESAMLDDPRPAVQLVSGLDGLLAVVEAHTFDFGDRARVPFAAYTVRAAQLTSQWDADALYRAAAGVAGVACAGLGTVLELIGAGRRDALMAALPGPADPADQATRFEAVLSNAIGLGLVNAGAASWRHSWYERVVLLNRGGLRLAMEPLLELASPQGVAELRGLLDALDVDLAAAAVHEAEPFTVPAARPGRTPG